MDGVPSQRVGTQPGPARVRGCRDVLASDWLSSSATSSTER